jgi:uncharacterized membrane protein YkoI
MKRTILFSASLASAIGFFALGADAQQQNAQVQGQARKSIAQIATMMEQQGYTVIEIELERGLYDVEMIDGKGMRVEAYLDPVTGEVLPYREDSKSYRRDGDDD